MRLVTEVRASVVSIEYEDYLLTHELTPCGPVPTALDPNGVYPYVSYCETSHRPVLKKYTFVTLENDHIKVTICPDLGGRVTSIVHKRSGRETLYVPSMVLPVRILPRFCFVAGGIQVSFPISHSPTGSERVLHRIDHTANRTYITCGERELRFGMQWSVEFSLGPEDVFLTERVLFHNPATSAYPWMSWSNAALPSAPDTEYHFPNGEALSHSSRIEVIDWEKRGPKRESDVKEMTGFFWKRHHGNAFGAYTPSLGIGLYHLADVERAPGIKLWTYGVGADGEWALAATAPPQPYIEIQGGPIADQSIKLELKPKDTRWHIEYWIPTDRPLDIYALKVPETDLRPVIDIPLFGWARTEEVSVWNELASAYEQSLTAGVDARKAAGSARKLPKPPEISQNRWAPSGMETLCPAFEWAIEKTRDARADLWKLHYGTWLAGRGETDGAIRILSDCSSGVAKALLARLHRAKGDKKAAARTIEEIQETCLQLHPQVVVERDKLLRELGPQTVSAREQWLSRVGAPGDEWIIERKIQLLIDKDEIQNAKQVLLSALFQKVHQTYTRTALWKQICEMLKEPWDPIPESLGEDRLARFGAYREFE
jgi:hypothetical protein